MPTYVQVTNPQNNLSWEKQLSNEELAQVQQHCKGQPAINIFAATLKPVRTDNWENFSKDFFLPTLKNHALKVQHAVGKIFAILSALILDLITFPIRLITCIPRVITNSKKDEHPLYRYLQTNAVDPRISESDHVLVKFGWEGRSQLIAEFRNEDGTVTRTPDRSQFWQKKPVNFVELPTYEGSDVFSRGSFSM
jgi:hypothetical protein